MEQDAEKSQSLPSLRAFGRNHSTHLGCLLLARFLEEFLFLEGLWDPHSSVDGAGLLSCPMSMSGTALPPLDLSRALFLPTAHPDINTV